MLFFQVQHHELIRWDGKPWQHRRRSFFEKSQSPDDVASFMAHQPRLQPAVGHREAPVPPGAHQALNDEAMEEDGVDQEQELGYRSDSDNPSDRSPSPPASLNDHGPRAWQSVQLFRLDAPPAELRIRWDRYEPMHRDICARLRIPWRHLLTIYEVDEGPEDLEAADQVPLLLRQRGDLRIGDNLRMVLLDVQFHNAWPSAHYEVVRDVLLCPDLIHRAALLDVLGLSQFCDLVKRRCLVWVNRKLIGLQSRALIKVDHGDYIKIAVPPLQGDDRCRCDIPTRFVAALAHQGVHRRHFRHHWEVEENEVTVRDFPNRRLRMDRTASSSQSPAEPQDHVTLVQQRLQRHAWHGLPVRHGLGFDTDLCSPREADDWSWDQPESHEDATSPPLSGRFDVLQNAATWYGLVSEWLLFAAVGEDEVSGVSFYAYFLHGVHALQCLRPRVVLLGADTTQWLDAFLHLWRDRIVATENIEFFIVNPSPPKDDAAEPSGHIIIVQQPPPEFPAILLSSQVMETPWTHKALFARRTLTQRALLLLADVGPLCFSHVRNHQCSVYWSSHLIDPDVQVNAHVGAGYRIIVDRLSQTTTEEHSLLQTDTWSSPLCRLDGEVDDWDPHVGADDPRLWEFWAQRGPDRPQPPADFDPAFLRELEARHVDQVRAGPIDDETYVTHQTWYLSSMTLRQCLAPREVRLGRDRSQWRDRCLHAWRDRIDPTFPVEFYHVHPSPPRSADETHAGHVILLQHAMTEHRACLATTKVLDYDFRHRAVLGPAMLSKYHAVLLSGLQNWCYRGNLRFRCLVSSEWDGIDDHSYRPIEHGFSFKSIVFDRQPPMTAFGTLSNGMTDVSGFQTLSSAPWMDDEADLAQHRDVLLALDGKYHECRTFPDADRETPIKTWFVHHENFPRCEFHRVVLLGSNRAQWLNEIRRVWADRMQERIPFSVELIRPAPPDDGRAPHTLQVMVTQWDPTAHAGGFDRVAVLHATRTEWELRLVAESISTPTTRGALLWYAQAFDPCRTQPHEFSCTIWKHGQPLIDGVEYDFVNAESVYLEVWRPQRDPHLPQTAELLVEQDDVVMLQKATPRPKVVLNLAELLGTEGTGPADIENRRLRLHNDPDVHLCFLVGDIGLSDLPPFLECDGTVSTAGVQRELCAWTFEGDLYHLTPWDVFFVQNMSLTAKEKVIIFVPAEDYDLHAFFVELTLTFSVAELFYMRRLHARGCTRAVIMKIEQLSSRVMKITYHNNVPEIMKPEEPLRTPTPLPERWPPHTSGLLPVRDTVNSSYGDCHVQVIVPDGRPHQLLGMGTKTLMQQWDHLDLHPATVDFLSDLPTWDLTRPLNGAFDRLLIYTDATSHPLDRHKSAAWNADQGRYDAWAFAVLGERYDWSDTHSRFTFLGWHAQTVVNDEQGQHYIRSDRLGADLSEKEALFWAILWRLSENHNTPTLLCTDSMTGKSQAEGLMHGASTLQTTHAVHRPILHVTAHAGDPMNELVDVLAKEEARRGLGTPRFDIDLRPFRSGLPHLWMFCGTPQDLPAATASGLMAQYPALPDWPHSLSAHTSESQWCRCDHQVSLATANVGSLFAGPDGHAGKVHLLKMQMKAHALNIMGLQETRSPPGVSSADGVIRIASGCEAGNFGVELWLNTEQPIAYANGRSIFIAKQQVTVLWAHPRGLLVRLQTECLDAHILVGHGPQSGRPEAEREEWWRTVGDLLCELPHTSYKWLLLDANARSGATDSRHVLDQDDEVTPNTSFFRELLDRCDLFLPAIDHCHHGEQGTWTHPGNLTRTRIDFVCLPVRQRDHCLWSCAVSDFDLGNATADHEMAAVQLRWQEEAYVVRSSAKAQSFDRDRIARERIDLNPLPHDLPPWSVDVETQTHQMQVHISQQLVAHCPRGKSSPKKSYIDDDIWQQRTAKLTARKKHHALGKAMRKQILWKVWRSLEANHHARQTAVRQGLHPDSLPDSAFAVVMDTEEIFAYDFTLNCARLCSAAALQRCTRTLRAQLTTARNDALKRHLESIGPEVPAGQVLRSVKPYIGPTNLRKAKKQSLPMLQRMDGQVCQSKEELLDEWARFLGDMEGGRRVQQHELFQLWADSLPALPATDQLDALADLPSLASLEDAFRTLREGART